MKQERRAARLASLQPGDQKMPFAPYALAALFAAILYWMYRSHHLKTMAGRSRLFDECLPLLQNPALTHSEAGYAQLEGTYEGYRIRLALEEDHLTMRKIPSLWLHLIVESTGVSTEGTLGMLVRPQNTEFYSPLWNWAGTVVPLAGWPEYALYRTQDTPPDLQLIDAHVQKIFSDEKAKELLLMPRAVRLTYQAKQADRGEYLLLRATDFNHEPLSSATVLDLLQRSIGIRRDLEGAIA
jgi:hypothetical protein